MKVKFTDGVRSLFNNLLNSRDATQTNSMYATRLTYPEMQSYYMSGLGSKIVRIKTAYALEDALIFDNEDAELFYEENIQNHLLKAVRYMLGFGRGVMLIFNEEDDLSKPLVNVDREKTMIRVFSGDAVTESGVSMDLSNERYYKPEFYNIFGNTIHHSHIIDFTYFEPPELLAPDYRYGGVSEFELIHDSLISDGIVHRAGANIVDRSANLIYKLKGFKRALQEKKSSSAQEYVSLTERFRSIAGGTIIDSDDEILSVSQTIPNYSEIETSMLRRVATVTSIPYPILVGESVKGLQSSGEQERQSFNDTLKALRKEYAHEKLQILFNLFNLGGVKFKETQGTTPIEKATYDGLCIDNATKLDALNLGGGAKDYLIDKGVVKDSTEDDFFGFNSDDEKDIDMSKSLAELLNSNEAANGS